MISGHGGNIYVAAHRLGCQPAEIVDMSSNINPLGPPEGLRSYLRNHLAQILNLPDVSADTIVHHFAEHYDLDPKRILAGNGTTQFIYTAPLALQMKKALIIGPTYADYADACRMHQVEFDHLVCRAQQDFNADVSEIESRIQGCDTVFICNPNNPTGGLFPSHQLANLCAGHAQIRFIIDESYLPFVPSEQMDSMISAQLPNVVVLHSLSKVFRIPGLRIGFLVASSQVIDQFRTYQQPWSVNCLAQTACEYLLRPDTDIDAFIRQTQDYLENERCRFQELNTSRHFHVFPSTTTFVLVRLSEHITADALCERVLHHRILLRDCTNFMGLSDRFVRISLRTSEINQMLIQLLLRLSTEISQSLPHPSHPSTVSH